MEHKSRTLIHMARTKWKPRTPEQREALQALRRRVRVADRADEEMWEAVRACRALDVPRTYLAEFTGRGRTTVYRHLGETTGEE